MAVFASSVAVFASSVTFCRSNGAIFVSFDLIPRKSRRRCSAEFDVVARADAARVEFERSARPFQERGSGGEMHLRAAAFQQAITFRPEVGFPGGAQRE